jgi:hypothetical protein
LDCDAETKTLTKLHQLRQGGKQKFEDFRQQFEQLTAQARTIAPQGSSKIAVMKEALNRSLLDTLVPIQPQLSIPDYDKYVDTVQKVATAFEATPQFHRPMGSTTHYLGGRAHQSPEGYSKSAAAPGDEVDMDVDIKMADINALIAIAVNMFMKGKTLVAVAGSFSRQDKSPRAPWRTQAEFNSLVQAGKCARCKKTKHNPQNCDFQAAKQPAAQVAAATTSMADTSDNETRDESENSEN